MLILISIRNQVNAALTSYFYTILHHDEKKKKEPPFIIPPNTVNDIMKDPFTGDGSQGPSDHLRKLEARCSLFKQSGISHDDVKKKLFYVCFQGEAKEWYHSLNHS
jgi:hypothetical protein